MAGLSEKGIIRELRHAGCRITRPRRAVIRALLEDEMGWGYILMAGDRIRNGYVINVEDDKATFQVEEYGGYRTTVLELNPE